MNNRRFIKPVRQLSALLLLYMSTNAVGQTKTTDLDIEDAVKTASLQNRSILLARLDERIARENYGQTNALFLPHVNISYTAFTTNNPLNAFGSKLQQQIIAPSDFNPATLNAPNATSDVMTKLSVQQPIFNMDMLYQRKAMASQAELYHYKTERNIEFIAWQVKQVYLQLQLAWEVNDVMQEALNTANATYKATNDRFEQGLLQKYELLNVEVEVKNLEARCAASRANVANASDYISLLMNKDQGVLYRTKQVTFDEQKDSIDLLPHDRADFRAMEAAVSSYNYMISSSRAGCCPRINAFGDYQLHDKGLFGFSANSYLAGIQLSWDIFNGSQTVHKTNVLLLERNKLVQQLEDTKAQGLTELSKAALELTVASYKIRQQTEAVTQAEEALRIVQNRYEQGLVTTTDMLLSQTQLSQQKLAYAQAVYDRNSARIYLQFLTINHLQSEKK